MEIRVYKHTLFLKYAYLFTITIVYCQPTITLKQWMSKQNKQSKFHRIQTTLDFILLEIKRQNHENRRLKLEILKLRSLSKQQEEMLRNLTIDKEAQCTANTSRTKNNISNALKKPYLYGVYPQDCNDVFKRAPRMNGTYAIKPQKSDDPFFVVCEDYNGTVWTVIQRRKDGTENFYRGWQDYKTGFGNLNSEFWLGNEKIHSLTVSAKYKLRIEMWDWGDGYSEWDKERNDEDFKRQQGWGDRNFNKGQGTREYVAESSFFRIENETSFYKLQVPDDFYAYHGYGGSGLRVHAGPFMTFDHIPEHARENCAKKFHCGWWFRTCVTNANLNGKYFVNGYVDSVTKERSKDDIYWPNVSQSLRKVEMKISIV